MVSTHFTASIALLVSLVLVGCVPRRESSVVVYCASDREYATPILDGFERNTSGTQIVRQFDVESSKTLGLVTRIEQEKTRPRCDVFWNNEILHTIRLQKQGLLASRRWKVPDDWPKGCRSSDGTWVGFAARARVLLVNRDKLPKQEEWPKSVLELANAGWKHRCGMANPVYGTTATHMTVLATSPQDVQAINASQGNGSVHPVVQGPGSWNWENWLTSVASNAVVLAGNKQVAIAVSRGELDWGLTDTDDAVVEIESGHPVAIVFPDQFAGGFGTLLIPNTVAIVKDGPNPVAANALADYLITERVEGRLTMGNSAQFPLWPNASEQPRLLKDRSVRWANVDFEKTAESWPKTLDRIRTIVGR
jgi:iron(III) transport system substrate-binding protein